MERDMLLPVVGELDAFLSGARVDKVLQSRDGSVCLQMHIGRNRPLLLLSADRRLPRMHMVSRRPVPAPAPGGFFQFLRKQVTGARVGHVRILNDDRVVEITFARMGRNVFLVFELTGSSANLILTADDQRILSVLHPSPAGRPGQRLLLPGSMYEPPPKRPAPENRTAGAMAPSAEEERGNLAANAAAERYFARILEEREAEQLGLKVTGEVRRELRKRQRRIDNLSQDLERAERAEEYQRAGSLILENLAKLRKGQKEVMLTGHEGVTVAVVLDPSKGPAENAEYYFRRAKKARTALQMVREQLEDAQESADVLRIALEDLLNAHDVGSIIAIRDRFVRFGFLKEQRGAERKIGPSGGPPVRSVLFGEWEILVGKNAAGNDHLTMKIARPDDIWLHAEGMPGSHVLIRNPRRIEVPQEVIGRAAGLAAYFSRGKGATKVPVAYTQARFVRKPRGAKPGMVLLEERKTVMAHPDPA